MAETELPIRVRIVGVPGACANGTTEPWRDVAQWAARQLAARFGEQVVVEYYDLFSPEMDRSPEALALVQQGQAGVPLVFVGDQLLSAGRKISVPAIRQALVALGLQPILSEKPVDRAAHQPAGLPRPVERNGHGARPQHGGVGAASGVLRIGTWQALVIGRGFLRFSLAILTCLLDTGQIIC